MSLARVLIEKFSSILLFLMTFKTSFALITPTILSIFSSYNKILVCPVTDYKQRERKVYLPKGDVWIDVWTQQKYDGGQWVTVSAPLSQIPLFCKDGFDSTVILNAAKENGLE